MPDAVLVAAVLSVAMVVSTWLLTRTLSKLNIVIATSGAPEAEAVSDEDLNRLRNELEGGEVSTNNEPAPLGQWTYEGAAKMLEGDL